ncbi:MAG: ABC transporter ATP-binding protein [Myxococcales bacterium]|nr:ABC transporter ATP-binding protein [Myxococcales bacterium]
MGAPFRARKPHHRGRQPADGPCGAPDGPCGAPDGPCGAPDRRVGPDRRGRGPVAGRRGPCRGADRPCVGDGRGAAGARRWARRALARPACPRPGPRPRPRAPCRSVVRGAGRGGRRCRAHGRRDPVARPGHRRGAGPRARALRAGGPHCRDAAGSDGACRPHAPDPGCGRLGTGAHAPRIGATGATDPVRRGARAARGPDAAPSAAARRGRRVCGVGPRGTAASVARSAGHGKRDCVQRRSACHRGCRAPQSSPPTRHGGRGSPRAAMTTESRLAARGLGWATGERWVLLDAEIDLRAGELALITGGNGAGKSTLLELLAGVRAPGRGTVLLDGRDLRTLAADEVAQRVVLLGHRPGLWLDLGARENVALFCALAGVDATRQSVEGWLDAVAIRPSDRSRPVRGFSRGMAQRVAWARVLACGADVWLLDEPSTGLDVNGIAGLRQHLAAARRRGVAIAVATHDPALEEFADRRLEVDHGRVQQVAP